MIVGGGYILNDKINSSSKRESETTENELKNMEPDWKIE